MWGDFFTCGGQKMQDHNLNTILNFAIKKEHEAIEFYTEIKEKYGFNISIIDEIIKMEQGHAEMLEKIKVQEIDLHPVKAVNDLQITDYLVDMEPHANMGMQELLIIAAKREEAARQLYTDLASYYRNTALCSIFTSLANEEAKHKLEFEELYDEKVLEDN